MRPRPRACGQGGQDGRVSRAEKLLLLFYTMMINRTRELQVEPVDLPHASDRFSAHRALLLHSEGGRQATVAEDVPREQTKRNGRGGSKGGQYRVLRGRGEAIEEQEGERQRQRDSLTRKVLRPAASKNLCIFCIPSRSRWWEGSAPAEEVQT